MLKSLQEKWNSVPASKLFALSEMNFETDAGVLTVNKGDEVDLRNVNANLVIHTKEKSVVIADENIAKAVVNNVVSREDMSEMVEKKISIMESINEFGAEATVRKLAESDTAGNTSYGNISNESQETFNAVRNTVKASETLKSSEVMNEKSTQVKTDLEGDELVTGEVVQTRDIPAEVRLNNVMNNLGKNRPNSPLVRAVDIEENSTKSLTVESVRLIAEEENEMFFNVEEFKGAVSNAGNTLTLKDNNIYSNTPNGVNGRFDNESGEGVIYNTLNAANPEELDVIILAPTMFMTVAELPEVENTNDSVNVVAEEPAVVVTEAATDSGIEVESGRMKELLGIPEEDQIADHYTSGVKLADDLMKKVGRADAMKMINFAANFTGEDLFRIARDHLANVRDEQEAAKEERKD